MLLSHGDSPLQVPRTFDPQGASRKPHGNHLGARAFDSLCACWPHQPTIRRSMRAVPLAPFREAVPVRASSAREQRDSSTAATSICLALHGRTPRPRLQRHQLQRVYAPHQGSCPNCMASRDVRPDVEAAPRFQVQSTKECGLVLSLQTCAAFLLCHQAEQRVAHRSRGCDAKIR